MRPGNVIDPPLRATQLLRARVEAFLRTEAASGVLLLVAAVVALGVANSPLGAAYERFWAFPLGVQSDALTFERSLAWFVNDGLMAVFFFVVGLEIRREIHAGELSEWRRASVPLAAALGGLSLPAGLYLFFAHHEASRAGWGVPMATDIAFAVGILALLGPRVPASMRVLLLAVAVIDDLGAILIIAFFYSSGISLVGCVVALLGFGSVLGLQFFRVRSKLAYAVPALVTWAGVYAAGVHPTIAGVALGLVTPVIAWPGKHDSAGPEAAPALSSPAEGLIHVLHPWVAYGVMPIFALANAGVSLSGFAGDAVSWGVVKGVLVGLVLGKPVGVCFATWLVVKLGFGELPRELDRRHVLVLAVVAGIGFTMSLFVGQLAFTEGPLLEAAKLGVLAASGLAGVLTLVLGRLLLRAPG